MNKIVNVLKKYMYVVAIFLTMSIVLSVTYSNFIVTSNNHKAAEMYIGELKYSMEIDGTATNTLTIPTGETIIDVKVNNLNPVDTYYKLLYLKNTNITVKYYESTKDTEDVATTYNKPNDSIISSNSNTIKLLITNSSTSSQNIALTIKGGYITNTIQDIPTPSTYSEIALIEKPSTNTYFCKTNDVLKQGLKYVNGQYTYAYGQEIKSTNTLPVWQNMSSDGWGVQLTNSENTDSVTSNLCTYINNKPLISTSYMFAFSKASSINLDFNTGNVKNMSYMFSGASSTTLDVSNFDTSNVINMDSMFADTSVSNLNLDNFNTSKVENMSGMFYDSKVSTLDLSCFDTKNVTNMSFMFRGVVVNEINISTFDTSNVINMASMFESSGLTSLNLANFDTANVINMLSMFNKTSIKTIYVSNKFNTSKVLSSNFMFSNSSKLIGGAGTKYSFSNPTDKTYARIDGGTSSPGYFTDIADKDIPDPVSFSTDSWKTIIKAVRNDNISKYSIGDTKEIELDGYGTHTLRIANTSTPSECSTTGFSQTACGFVLEFADIITKHNMNDTETNIGGWPATSMRTFVNNDIYNAIPSEIKNAIIDTTVVSGHGSEDTANFTSTDKLYLLAPKEIYTDFDDTDDAAKDLTRTLDYYTNIGVTTSSYSGAIKSSYWWLRTAISRVSNGFLRVGNFGGWSAGFANYPYVVVPAFRIG